MRAWGLWPWTGASARANACAPEASIGSGGLLVKASLGLGTHLQRRERAQPWQRRARAILVTPASRWLWFGALLLGMSTAAQAQLVAGWTTICSQSPTSQCQFEVAVPRDQWQEVSSELAARGDRVFADGSALFSGQLWGTANASNVARRDLDSAAAVLDSFQLRAGVQPWVLARFVPALGELVISAFKTAYSAEDGAYRLLVSRYTPAHGEYFKAQQRFLSPSDLATNAVATPGLNPYARFQGVSPSDPVFQGIDAQAVAVVLGYAMAHYQSAYGMMIEASVSVRHTQTAVGSWERLLLSHQVEVNAKPKFWVALPANLSPTQSTAQAVAVPSYCPKAVCTSSQELAVSPVVLLPLSEAQVQANAANVADRLYSGSVSSSTEATNLTRDLTAAANLSQPLPAISHELYLRSYADTLAADAESRDPQIQAKQDVITALEVSSDGVERGVYVAPNAATPAARDVFQGLQTRHINSDTPGASPESQQLSGTQALVGSGQALAPQLTETSRRVRTARDWGAE